MLVEDGDRHRVRRGRFTAVTQHIEAGHPEGGKHCVLDEVGGSELGDGPAGRDRGEFGDRCVAQLLHDMLGQVLDERARRMPGGEREVVDERIARLRSRRAVDLEQVQTLGAFAAGPTDVPAELEQAGRRDQIVEHLDRLDTPAVEVGGVARGETAPVAARRARHEHHYRGDEDDDHQQRDRPTSMLRPPRAPGAACRPHVPRLVPTPGRPPGPIDPADSGPWAVWQRTRGRRDGGHV